MVVPEGSGSRRGAAAFAAAIALVAWAGVALNFVDVYSRLGSVLWTAWSLAEYFTILTNLVIAILFTELALRPKAPARPRLLAGVTLAILLVGIVYQLLLQGLYQFNAIAQVADVLLHKVTPVMVPAFWLLLASKGRLTLRDPLLWALYPLAYFVYAVARGSVTHHYPYPFMDAGKIGWPQATINAAVIAAGFLITGGALVWLDGMLAGRSTPRL